MKRQFDDVQALQLGELWGSLFEPTGIMDEIDLIAPIPTHWSRRLQRRGFHASRLISEGIRRMTGVPIANHLIKQNRMTSKQGKLTIRQRFQNLKGAFSCNRKNNVQDMRVLLVDDVMTSGATASEAARVVCAAGAQKVFVGVVARGARVS